MGLWYTNQPLNSHWQKVWCVSSRYNELNILSYNPEPWNLDRVQGPSRSGLNPTVPPTLGDRWHISASTLSLNFHCVKCKEHLSPEASGRMQGDAICKVLLRHNRQLIPISVPISQIMAWGQIHSHDKESKWGHIRRRSAWVLAVLPTVRLLPLTDPVLPRQWSRSDSHWQCWEGSGAQGPSVISGGQRGVGVESVHGSAANLQTNLQFWKEASLQEKRTMFFCWSPF